MKHHMTLTRIALTAATTLALTLGAAGIAQAEPGDSAVTANGTYQVVDPDGNAGPILHGRHTYTMGPGWGVQMSAGSCKSVDADGKLWGPLRVRPGLDNWVACYGSNWSNQ